MAGALMRAAPRALPAVGRAVGGALAYWALDGAAAAVGDWIDRRQWQTGKRHRGLDLPAPVGTPVLAPTDAIVIGEQQTEDGGLELFLAGPRMQRADPTDPQRWPRPSRWFAMGTTESGRDEAFVDDSGWRFGFAHLSGTNVPVGSVVRRGQQVATTGNTGVTTGPHLHLTNFWVEDSLRDIHIFVDPAMLIPGLPRSVPTAAIGPGSYISVCILSRLSTREQAVTQVVVQQMPTGLGINWAATLQGVK